MKDTGKTIEERISLLLDKLENPYLTDADIDRIQKKIELLKSMQ